MNERGRNQTEFSQSRHSQSSRKEKENLGALMLTNRKQLIERIQNNDRLDEIIVYFFVMSIVCIVAYGMCLGFHSGFVLQIFSSGIKAPILFYGTMLICTPALYACNALIGPQLSFKQILSLLILKTYFISFILISAAPILFYFSFTSDSYEFTSVLNIVICAIAGSCGIYMLWTEMNRFSDQCKGKFMKVMLQIWLFIYMFVGTQMAWSLRPFIGYLDHFVWWGEESGNFYIRSIELLMTLLHIQQP